jgi:hypothetical protein
MTDNYNQLENDRREPSIVMGEPAPLYFEYGPDIVRPPTNTTKRNLLIAAIVIGMLLAGGTLIWWLLLPPYC